MTNTTANQFLSNVGQAVHSLNTICVGLSHVETDNLQKPPSLNIRWEPASAANSARMAREFAIKSSLVFACESLHQYVHDVMSIPAVLRTAPTVPNATGAAERFGRLSKSFGVQEREIVLVKLMIHLRNHIVHSGSRAKLTKAELSLIDEQKNEIYEAYHHLDTEELLRNFSRVSPTLKEVSTLVTISIRAMRQIHEGVISLFHAKEQVIETIKANHEELSYKGIDTSPHRVVKARKVEEFLRMHFGDLPTEIVSQAAAELVDSRILSTAI